MADFKVSGGFCVSKIHKHEDLNLGLASVVIRYTIYPSGSSHYINKE